MADEFLFLTELLGLKVYDLKGRRLGLVKDAAIVPLIHPSRVDRFLVGGGWAWLTVRHDQIRSISLDGIYLKDEQLTPYHSDEYMLRLVRDLLDQQIIDGQGRKVVRVTDVTFKHPARRRRRRAQHRRYRHRIAEHVAAPGARSGSAAAGSAASRLSFRPHSIRWEHCSIIEADPQRRLRLNISNKILERMHPADLADIVEDLSPDDREAIFETIDSEVAAETLSEMEPDVQASILESLETEKAADIVEEMSPHEAADVLAELEEQTSEDILEEMEKEPKAEVEELLEYHENSAGGLMNTEYVALPENTTVAGAMEALRSSRGDSGESEHAVPGGFGRPAEGLRSAGATVHRRRRDALAGTGRRASAARRRGRAAGSNYRTVRQIQLADTAGDRCRGQAGGRDHGR